MTKTIILGLIGALCSVLWKMQSVQKLAKKSNMIFSVRDYLKDDAISIILSFLSVGIWQLLFPEFAAKYPKLEDFILFSFFVMGAGGAMVIQKAVGKSLDMVHNVIDKKTDIADGKTTEP